MRKNTILSYEDYKNRMSSIKTPEEAAEVAKELFAPVFAGFKHRTADEIDETEIDEEEQDEPIVRSKALALPRSGKRSVPPPWSDVVNNENEAIIISLYAKGLTTRDIVSYMKSHHGVEMAHPGISAITDKVYPLVKEWQARPLLSAYPILYLDGLHFKVREAGKIVSKIAYIALGLNQYGLKEVLGIWTSESEGAKFWLSVLTDLKNRGVEDIFIACVDGLKGFPEAIRTIFPRTDVQICVVHQIRHTIKFIPFRDRKQFADDLKTIYGAPTEEAGREALEVVMNQWPQYRTYLKSWELHWADLATFFGYSNSIRKIIYTTNAIESLNHQFRKVTKTTTVFPHDDSLVKLLWLAQADITKKWIMPIRNWGEVVAQFSILFPDRIVF